jgi:two-component system copper resistance phosphate regulon response regulator CusR
LRLLLIENDKLLAEALSTLLKKKNYIVDTTMDGEAGVGLAVTGVYDIIVLECLLPNRDGLSVLNELRKYGLETPVMFLTSKTSPVDLVEVLDSGADDYLSKPFSTEEFLARLRALVRRKNKALTDNTVRTTGLLLDPMKRQVTTKDGVISLTPKESQILELLMQNYGKVIPKERILEKAWGYNTKIETANVDLFIHFLRKKLKNSSIKTARGLGYYMLDNQDDTGNR